MSLNKASTRLLDPDSIALFVIGTFRKRRQQRERRYTKDLGRKAIALHVRFKFLCISLLSSVRQQREMTNF